MMRYLLARLNYRAILIGAQIRNRAICVMLLIHMYTMTQQIIIKFAIYLIGGGAKTILVPSVSLTIPFFAIASIITAARL